jgi:hypothetical protein
VGLTKIPARFMSIEIEIVSTWTAVGGITDMTPSPSDVNADTGDYDSEGLAEHMVMERGRAFTLSGWRLEDVATGERDPGQAAIEALSEEIGPEANGHFRITSPGGLVDTFLASVSDVTAFGGGKNDPAAWGATLTVSGAIEHSGS